MRGVYIIKNLRTSYVYIGSSNKIEYRIEDHFLLLDKGRHYNINMQFAYKRDKSYFVWGACMLFGNDVTRKFIYQMEQYYLDMYQKKYNILINATDHLLEDKSKREKTRQWRLKL